MGTSLFVLGSVGIIYIIRRVLPDPVEAIKFEMEQKGLTIKDLEPMIGKSNRVYEILNCKRSLTFKMIQKLRRELGIPAESLIKTANPHKFLHKKILFNSDAMNNCEKPLLLLQSK